MPVWLAKLSAAAVSLRLSAAGAVSTGASLTGVTVSVLVTAVLLAAEVPLALASVTTQEMVRVVEVAVGLSDVLA